MIEPVWMESARRAAVRLGASTRAHPGASHYVYVVLLHNPACAQSWGSYVGQTSRDPDWRFDQHKMGYKASSAVKRFGVRTLPQLTEHLNPMLGWEALDLEAALANAACLGPKQGTNPSGCEHHVRYRILSIGLSN